MLGLFPRRQNYYHSKNNRQIIGAYRLHVPLELDVEADVNVDGVEDQLQGGEGLVVVVQLLLEGLGSG